MSKIIDFQPKRQRYCILVGYNESGEPATATASYEKADGSGGIFYSISANSLDEIPDLIKIAQKKAQKL